MLLRVHIDGLEHPMTEDVTVPNTTFDIYEDSFEILMDVLSDSIVKCLKDGSCHITKFEDVS